ncbi:hypothetical protein HZI73_26240 (plasmid) [Vallitalea pronyensis]|uniref:Uncharacterized protein n=1 Tax=Vallitalea pronyensis TaxID=1348613 RepID=A0A8J8SJF7_9FIRM|nr:hypothetical protein [Vallitalea pronyensis]QUI25915.1 hypothetical protein HZI73_26240 [Vallitalea pronyensis]
MKCLKDNKGSSGILSILLIAFFVIFLIMPVFAAVFEKQMMTKIARDTKSIIKDSLEATYTTLNIEKTSIKDIEFTSDFKQIFDKYVIDNLNLNVDFTPTDKSMADAKVQVTELQYEDRTRKFINVKVILPIKPHIYRQILLSIMGKEWIGYEIPYTLSLPVDN